MTNEIGNLIILIVIILMIWEVGRKGWGRND